MAGANALLEKLPKIFRTAGKAHTLASSATGVWEAALVSTVEGTDAYYEYWGVIALNQGQTVADVDQRMRGKIAGYRQRRVNAR